MKKLKTNKQLNAALDKLQKEFNEFKKGRSQNAPTPENLKPSKSGELEKQEYIFWEGNYVTDKDNGLYKVLKELSIRCVIEPYGKGVRINEFIYSPSSEYFTQAPDSMILDYLMKGYREKGWKEGCEYYGYNKKDGINIAKSFDLTKTSKGYKIYVHCKEAVTLIDECTLLPDKLTFNGVEADIDSKVAWINIMKDSCRTPFLKDELIKFKDILIPERKAEVERILKAMEE